MNSMSLRWCRQFEPREAKKGVRRLRGFGSLCERPIREPISRNSMISFKFWTTKAVIEVTLFKILSARRMCAETESALCHAGV